MRFAVLVICKDGRQEYLRHGPVGGPVALFSKRAAEEQRDFMLIGMEDEVQSINVVPAP